MYDIFKLTDRPAEEIFYSKNDPDDKKLGEEVMYAPKYYDESSVVLIGSPQDKGVKRNKGRAGARNAPDEIRAELYKLVTKEKIEHLNLFDIGDIKIQSSLEETHAIQEKIIFQLLNDGKRIIVLGGGNDISYPDCKALSNYNRNLLAINIDSHPDVRFDIPRNSGTPYRMLLEENLIDGENFYEIGLKPYALSTVHENYLKQKNVPVYTFEKVKETGISILFDKILSNNRNEVIFWGFDMDSVRGPEAPGVSAPAPYGFTSDEAVELAKIAGRDKRTKIFEISEVNPVYDIDKRTSKLAAIMIWSLLNEINSNENQSH
ncbi:MAG: arginase [Ignavibacteriales bacterium]|nr:MAG: arginase [Ignavibacteriales bacterium]